MHPLVCNSPAANADGTLKVAEHSSGRSPPMKPSRTLEWKACLRGLVVLVSLAFCFISPGRPQKAAGNDQSADKLLEEINRKYPGLLTDLGHLLGRLENDIHYPAPRSESRMLPLLPESTVI